MGLNNGQSFYQPSYMLVAMLKTDTAPSQYKAAINCVYNHFYHHDFVYDHSRDNCSGVSIDTPRTQELLAATKTIEEMRAYMEADSLAFLSVDGNVVWQLLAIKWKSETANCTSMTKLPLILQICNSLTM